MPEANNWDIGDGLNVAGYRWVRTLKGSDTVYGSGEDNLRKAINIKIDHNLNDSHRLSGRYTDEQLRDVITQCGSAENGGYGGSTTRYPQSFSVNLTSTLKPTLLNEFRMGLSRTSTHSNEPLQNPASKDQMLAILNQLMPTDNFPNYVIPADRRSRRASLLLRPIPTAAGRPTAIPMAAGSSSDRSRRL